MRLSYNLGGLITQPSPLATLIYEYKNLKLMLALRINNQDNKNIIYMLLITLSAKGEAMLIKNKPPLVLLAGVRYPADTTDASKPRLDLRKK